MRASTERKPSEIEKLYDHDLCIWAQTNAGLLRAGRLSEIDVSHIAEELEDMGKSERRALRSQIRNLVMHLLKWQFQPRQRSTSWELSILNARREIQIIAQDSPSLVPRIPEIMADEYPSAKKGAIVEAKLDKDAFPEQCPYTAEQIRDDKFWPRS